MDLQDFAASAEAFSLSFKGERPYITGADIIDELLARFGRGSGLSVKFYKMVASGLLARKVTNAELSDLRKSGAVCATLVSTYPDGTSQTIAVLEDIAAPAGHPNPYDEAAVTSGSAIVDSTISQGASSCGTFFDRVVALNKKLLNEVVAREKWIFVGIDMSSLPNDDVPLSVRFTIAGPRGMYISSVSTEGREFGKVYFLRQGVQ
jgi:hypothetical protein